MNKHTVGLNIQTIQIISIIKTIMNIEKLIIIHLSDNSEKCENSDC